MSQIICGDKADDAVTKKNEQISTLYSGRTSYRSKQIIMRYKFGPDLLIIRWDRIVFKIIAYKIDSD